jgi:hypothetical protein
MNLDHKSGLIGQGVVPQSLKFRQGMREWSAGLKVLGYAFRISGCFYQNLKPTAAALNLDQSGLIGQSILSPIWNSGRE